MALNPNIMMRKTVYGPPKLWEVVEQCKIILKFKSQSKIITDATILFLQNQLEDHVCENNDSNPISLDALEYLRSELFKIQHPPEEKKE